MARALHHARPQIAGEHLDSADHHHDADASQHQQAVTSSRSMAPDGPTITTSVSLNSGWWRARDRSALRAFMQAAGITCSQRLGDLAAQLPAAAENELVALLGGAP